MACGKLHSDMASQETFVPPDSPVGIIESLSTGFEIVASHLPLIAVPFALDMLVWLGPRLSLRQTNFEALTELLKTFQQMKSLYLPVFFVPNVIGFREAKPLPFAYTSPVYELLKPEQSYAVLGIAMVLGYLIWMMYAGLIGQRVAGRAMSPTALARQISAIAFQVSILFAVIALLLTLLLSLVATFANLLVSIMGAPQIGYNIFLIFALLLSGMLGALAIFFVFTPHSMFLNRNNLLAAMFDSVQVVQWNLVSTLSLLALIFLISIAMHSVWALAGTDSWIVLVAIAGNAFVSTGLIAATFVFFKDRHRYWRELRDSLIAEFERRRARQQQS